MTNLIDPAHLDLVRRFEAALFKLPAGAMTCSRSAPTPAVRPDADQAITLYPSMEHFLQQGIEERASTEDSLRPGPRCSA